MVKLITSKYLFDGEHLLKGKVIIIDKQIVDIVDRNNINEMDKVIDYGDNIIAPGFIDLQLNGCGGILFNNQINLEALEVMYQTCLKFGTSSFLPTLISCEFESVIDALEVTKDWFKKYAIQRGVLGIHLEGPFISTIKKGIHPEEFIIKPEQKLLELIVSYRKYFPIKMTIAIEEFTAEQIKYLVENQIILSIGHSNSSYSSAREAFNLGIKTATHTFNAMSGLTARNPGVVGAILNSKVYNGIIVDGFHVHEANVRLLVKLKADWTYLITDAVAPMGTDLKEFELAGKTIYVKDGKCLDENNILGGANLTMNQAISNCVNKYDISLIQALRMATSIPAKVMDLPNNFGRVIKGFKPNLIILNKDDFSCEVLNSIY